jgi:hypothetical protein
MKKIIILITTILTAQAYANIGVVNTTAWGVSLHCFPSGEYSWVSWSGTGTCEANDNEMYIGRVGMPETQDYLNSVTAYSYTVEDSSSTTAYHYDGNGKVWHITYFPGSGYGRCDLEGDPEQTMDCAAFNF